MKPYFLLFVLALFTSSCCKEVCPDESVRFHFRNFPGTDLNSIQFVTYQRGSGFTNPLDNFEQVYAITQSTPQNLRLTVQVSIDRDLEVIVPSLQATYRITEMQAERVKCNCESGNYRSLKSYRLNNVPNVADEVEISR